MEPRANAGRTSAPSTGNRAPSTGNRAPRPSPAHAAHSRLPAQPAPVERDDEWAIGVSDLAPWELAGTTGRPPALPAAQPAPWQQSAQPAPWDRSPAAIEPAPWDVLPQAVTPVVDAPVVARSGAAARTAAPKKMQPAPGQDSVPWDKPAPFSFDDDQSADPYDAFAPLADDFATEHSLVGASVGSVFGDVFAAPMQPLPLVEPPRAAASTLTKSFAAPAAVEAAPVDEPAYEPMPQYTAPQFAQLPTEGGPFEPAEPAEHAPVETAAVTAADEAPAVNPVEWPPVPTDFPPKKPKERARRQPPPNPLEWPPIPVDLFRPADFEPAAVEHDQPMATFQPPTPIETAPPPTSLWDAPAQPVAPVVSAEPAWPLTAGQPSWPLPAPQPVTAAAAHATVATMPAPVATMPAPVPAASAPVAGAPAAVEDDLWALPSFEPAGAAVATQSAAAADAAPEFADDTVDDQPGAVFARYATGVVPAPSRVPKAAAAPVAQLARSEATAARSDDLWFLSNDPASADAAVADAEADPSSMQTAVATVLVAAIVIGLVIVFLLLFTSFFR